MLIKKEGKQNSMYINAVLIFITILLYIMSIIAVKDIPSAIEILSNWKETEAIILESYKRKAEDSSLIATNIPTYQWYMYTDTIYDYYYQYNLDGIVYKGNATNSIVSAYKNQEITVMVNPNEYSDSIPKKEVHIIRSIIRVIISFGMAVLFTIYLIGELKLIIKK